MTKFDRGLRLYLLVLVLSWIIITVYLINYENTHKDDFYKKELESYPFDHSEIKDTTKQNGGN